MVDPKVTSQKAQEILKSMQKRYDDGGNMTPDYFEELEKDIYEELRRLLRKKPEQPTTEPTAVPPKPPPIAPAAGAGADETVSPKKPEVPITPPEQQPPVKQEVPVHPILQPKPDAVHRAEQLSVATAPAKISNKEHGLGKIKRLMESGATDEKTGKIEVTPEQALFTLEPLIPLFDKIKDDDVDVLNLLEVIGDVSKDKATDPDTGIINPMYSGRAVQVLKQSIVKNMRASEPVRKQILTRYNALIPFSEAEKRADPVVEAMDREFKEVFSSSVGDDVRLKLLGPEVAKRFVKYLDSDLMELTNKQLQTRAEAEPGAEIRRKQPTGRMVSYVITEEDISKARHELRVRGVIQKIQNFLWDNFGITTYLGASMFGSGTEPSAKRDKVFHNLNQSLKELNEELSRKESEVGKSSAVVFDSSEFPEETEDYFIIHR